MSEKGCFFLSQRHAGRLGAALVAGVLAAVPQPARAQLGVGQPGAAPQKPPPGQETHAAPGADDEPEAPPTQEPTLPQDPLAIPKKLEGKIGSDARPELKIPRAETDRRFYGLWYSEQRGDYQFRTLFPFWAERKLKDDRASLFGLVYFNRRSPRHDADVLFPLFWRFRDEDTTTTVVGPFMHRESEGGKLKNPVTGKIENRPARHDNWLPPLFFEGSSSSGSGYLHIPPLLTFTHHTARSGFNLVGPAFCSWKGGPACDTRSAESIDLGLVPFYFYGRDEGSEYEVIPPLLHYYSYSDAGDRWTNLWGPVMRKHSRESDSLHVMPFYWSNWSANEESRTLVPFFHYQRKGNSSVLATPLFVNVTGDHGENTFVTWGFARHRGRTELDMWTPLYWQYRDPDIGLDRKLLFPFFYRSTSPRSDDLAILPFYAHFKRPGLSNEIWVTPLVRHRTDMEGWETDIFPFFFMGRSRQSTHFVLAPLVWDFASPKSRATVILPGFFRFSDETTMSQLLLNTYYREKKVPGGTDWEFHFFPLFSYGQSPVGHWWNVLYGLAGYTQQGTKSKLRAFYVPIRLSD